MREHIEQELVNKKYSPPSENPALLVSRVNSRSRGVASHRLPRPPGWSPDHPRRATRWTCVPTAPCVPGGRPIVCRLLEHARLDHKRSLCREPRHLPLALHGLLGVYTDHPIEGAHTVAPPLWAASSWKRLSVSALPSR